MVDIVILLIEDEPEVREAVERDLEPFADTFRIECAEEVEEARTVMAEIEEQGDRVGLVLCDHLLPGITGVDFLVDLNHRPDTVMIRKVLITGQAGMEDTIKAINQGGLDHYIAKPWTPEQLHDVVRTQLTEYVLANEDDLKPFVAALDGPRLLEAMASRASDR